MVALFRQDSQLIYIFCCRESILGSHGEVADEFAVVVKALWQGQFRNITPRDFKVRVIITP